MEKMARLLVVLIVVVTLGVPAFAQYPTPEDRGFNYAINIGAGFAGSSELDNGTTLAVGLSWFDSAGETFGQAANFGMSGDWLRIERNNGDNVDVFPLLFDYKQYSIISGHRVFVTIGLGVTFLTDPIPEMNLEDGANFAWSGGLGMDVSNKLFFQARFVGGKDPSNDGLVLLQVGYRL